MTFLVLGKGSTKFGVDEVKAEHELNVQHVITR